MNGRTVLPAFALGRGRKAFALTEALILIVVVLVAIALLMKIIVRGQARLTA